MSAFQPTRAEIAALLREPGAVRTAWNSHLLAAHQFDGGKVAGLDFTGIALASFEPHLIHATIYPLCDWRPDTDGVAELLEQLLTRSNS